MYRYEVQGEVIYLMRSTSPAAKLEVLLVLKQLHVGNNKYVAVYCVQNQFLTYCLCSFVAYA
jgi:hypothetical protein